MIKAKIGRILVTSFLFFCVLWLATPKVYIHKLLDHKHEFFQSSGETGVQAEVDPDCDFDKYDTPVYFTLFKFINKFIPLKPKEEAFIIKHSSKPNTQIVGSGPSRAPPIV